MSRGADEARPPQMTRVPRRVPLSLAKGATPTRAEISPPGEGAELGEFGQEGEGDGRANPGTERSRSSLARQTGLASTLSFVAPEKTQTAKGFRE